MKGGEIKGPLFKLNGPARTVTKAKCRRHFLIVSIEEHNNSISTHELQQQMIVLV